MTKEDFHKHCTLNYSETAPISYLNMTIQTDGLEFIVYQNQNVTQIMTKNWV